MTTTNRRDFLKSIAAVAAASIVPTSVIAGVFAENKYEKAVRLYDEIVSLSESAVAADVIYSKLDQLFGHFRAEFAKTPLTSEHTQIVKNILGYNDSTVTYTEDDVRKVPPVVCDELLPILMTRFLLRYHQVAINPRKITEFTWFYNTYGSFIIKSVKS